MLDRLQEKFCDSIRQRQTQAIETEWFAEYPPEELSARLAIYRNNFFASLIETLKETFPTLCQLLGEDFFAATIKDFIEEHPPSQADIAEYGADLRAFLLDYAPLDAYAYVPDIARLDYCRHRAYYAENSAALKLEDFAALAPTQLACAKIEFHPATYLIASEFAIFSIWEANTKHGNEQVNADFPEQVLVSRPAKAIETCQLSHGLFAFLQNLSRKKSIEESLQCAAEADPELNASEAIHFLISSRISSKLLIPNQSGF